MGSNWASSPTDKDIVSPQPASSQEYYPTSTGSSDALDLAKSWLDDCLEHHKGCKQRPSGSKSKLPTRLIEISEVDGQLLPRLIITPAGATLADIQYCTLSHVWAATVRGPRKTVQLSPDNLEQLLKCIPFETLPQTFQDAIKITRRLGYQYIWIDSLCIIQHPSDTSDFHKEAVTMCDVYSHSSCNIAALGLGNDSGPLAVTASPVDYCYTTRNPLGYVPCRLVKSNESEAIYVGREEYRRLPDSLRKSPLLSRAWVFQERFLAPRILYFGTEQLYWECRRHTKSESRPVDTTLLSDFCDTSRAQFLALCDLGHDQDRYAASVFESQHDSETGRRMGDGINTESVFGTGPSDRTMTTVEVNHQLMMIWHRVVKEYTETDLTYASDRFIALAGIVQAIANPLKLTYAAGTWIEFWPFDILWVFEKGVQLSERTACGTNLPSWSWASTEGRKEFSFSYFADKLSVPTTSLLRIVNSSCPTFTEQHDHNAQLGNGPWEGLGITMTIQAFIESGEVTGLIKHPLTRQMVHGIKFGHFRHDYLDIWWDQERMEGDSVLVVPLLRSDGSYGSTSTVGLVLMRDKSTHIKNDERRYRRVGVFFEHSFPNQFKILAEDFDINKREEICLR